MTRSTRRARRANQHLNLSSQRIAGALVLAAVVASANSVLGHSGATGIVKQRMDHMKEIGAAMKTLSDQFKGVIAYDPHEVAAAAGTIRDHAGDDIIALFPADSMDHPTEAKPEIWQDWAGFRELAFELETAGVTLVEVVDDAQTPAGALPAFTDLAQTCSACHEQFRIKK